MLLLANKDFQLKKKRQTVYFYCNLAFALSTLSFSVLNKGTADIWRHCNIVALESDKTRNQTTWQSWKRPKVQAVLFGSNTGTDCKWNVSDSLLQGKTVTLCTRMCQRKHTYFRFLHTKKKKSPYACQVLKVGKYNLRWTITHYILYLIFIYLLKTSECERKKESLPHNSTTCRTRFCSNTLNKFLCLWLLFTVLP